MSNLNGEVQFISKSPKGFYSLKVNDVWYGFGRQAPTVDKGQVISCTYTTKGDFHMIDDGSLTVTEDAPATTGKTKSSGTTRDTYWENKAETDKVQQRIRELHAARGSAVETVQALVAAGAVKLPVKESGRYDALMALVDELTNRYFDDITGRFYGESGEVEDMSKYEEE